MDEARLRQVLTELWDMPFPHGSAIDCVDELHARLVEYDGYVAGIVQFDHWAGEIPLFNADLLRETEEALGRHPEAADELVAYIKRLRKIEEALQLTRAERRGDPA